METNIGYDNWYIPESAREEGKPIVLLPLPRWLEGPLRYYQSFNVWTCYHWTGFWRFVFHSHYFDVLLDECRKVFPFGGRRSVLDGYKSVYTNKLEAIYGADIHFWYGTKESFVAKPQAEHLLKLCPSAHIEVFKGMNHGQLLVDHPDVVARRIKNDAKRARPEGTLSPSETTERNTPLRHFDALLNDPFASLLHKSRKTSIFIILLIITN